MSVFRSTYNLMVFGFTLFTLVVGCEIDRPADLQNAIMIETEWFEDYGGWVHDSKFMDLQNYTKVTYV